MIMSTQCGRPSATLLTAVAGDAALAEERCAVPCVATMRKPSSRSLRATSSARLLVVVAHADEHLARRSRQRACRRRAAPWRTPSAKSSSMPITSPVERISGPEDRVDAGELAEREDRFLHRDVAAARSRRTPSSSSVAPTMHARGDLRERHARSPSTRTAPCATRAGSPRARRPSSPWTANCTFIRPTTPSSQRERRGLLARSSLDHSAATASTAAARTPSRPSGCPPPRCAP